MCPKIEKCFFQGTSNNKKNKLDLKIKTFRASKDTIKEVKKYLVSRIYKLILQLNIKKINYRILKLGKGFEWTYYQGIYTNG